MNETPGQSLICGASQAVAAHPLFIPLSISIVVVMSCGICLNIFLCYMLFRYATAFHRNTQILLTNLSLAIILMNGASVSNSVFYLVRVWENDPACPFLEEYGTCLKFQNVRVCGILGYQLSLILLAVERAVATWKYEKYEDMTNPVLVLIGLAAQWSVATMNALKLTSASSQAMPACNTLLFSKTSSHLGPVLFAILTEVSAGFIYFICLIVNKKKEAKVHEQGQSLHTLSIRYQLSENIRSTRMLLPSVMAHTAFVTICTSTIISVLLWHGGNLDLDPHKISTSAAIMESANLFLSFYGICHPVICVLQTPKFKKVVGGNMKSLKCMCKKDQGAATAAKYACSESQVQHIEVLPTREELHFRMLDSLFSTMKKRENGNVSATTAM